MENLTQDGSFSVQDYRDAFSEKKNCGQKRSRLWGRTLSTGTEGQVLFAPFWVLKRRIDDKNSMWPGVFFA